MDQNKVLPYPVWPTEDVVSMGWADGMKWPGKAVHRGITRNRKDVVQVLVRQDDGFLKLLTWQVGYLTDINPAETHEENADGQ